MNGRHDVSVDNGGDSDGSSTIVQPSSSPVLTGTLELLLGAGMGPIAHRLLSLPSGIHFRKLTLEWRCEEDIPLTTALVEKCSHTLKSLNITNNLRGTSPAHLRPYRSKTHPPF